MAIVRNGQIVYEDELLQETRAELAQKTGTCEPACMNALDTICKCYCRGLNHGRDSPEYQAEVAYDIPEPVALLERAKVESGKPKRARQDIRGHSGRVPHLRT